SRSRGGIFPLRSFPPNGSHRRVTPSARISVVKMFASDPPTMTLSSRAWAVGVLSAAGSGVIRGDVGRVAMPDDIPTARIRAGTRHHVGAGVACHQMAYEDILYENRGPATWITINRPERRNAVRPQTYTELRDAFRRAAADEATG